MPRLLLVFLKEPIPGCVKTRLAADLGEEEATRIYRALVEVLLLQLRGLENCRIRFCYTPDDADDAIRFWILPYLNAQANGGDGADSYLIPAPDGSTQQPQEVDFSPQGKGDLGERLTRAFDQGFADGYSEIAVIGSDCPQCGARWINAAFSRLTAMQSPASVIGPSTDGGYYLLMLDAPQPELFRQIPWSSELACKETQTAAQNISLPYTLLPPLSDVDTHSDWLKLLETPLGAALKKNLGIKPDALSFGEAD